MTEPAIQIDLLAKESPDSGLHLADFMAP